MLRRLWALIQKEFIQLIRDRQLLIALLIGPALYLPLYAGAVHMDVQHIPMVVADQSQSPASRSYVNAYTDSDAFAIVSTVSDQAGALHAIDSGQASLGIVIPPDFDTRVQQQDANVLMLVDGSDSFVTRSAFNSAAAISGQYAIRLTRQVVSPVTAHIQILYNPDLQDIWFILPGLVSFMMFGIALKMTAFAIVREREMGTIEALLVTPIRPIELMIAKTIPNLCVATVNTVSILAIGIFIYQVPFRGSFPLFFAVLVLFAFSSLGLGIAISAVSQTQMQANQLATLVNIAAIFLCGFLFPVYALPWALRLLGYLSPLTYVLPISNGIFTKGIGLDYLWAPVLGMLVLTGIILFLGARLFRQHLD